MAMSAQNRSQDQNDNSEQKFGKSFEQRHESIYVSGEKENKYSDPMIQQREQKYQDQIAFENWKQMNMKAPYDNQSKFSTI